MGSAVSVIKGVSSGAGDSVGVESRTAMVVTGSGTVSLVGASLSVGSPSTGASPSWVVVLGSSRAGAPRLAERKEEEVVVLAATPVEGPSMSGQFCDSWPMK